MSVIKIIQNTVVGRAWKQVNRLIWKHITRTEVIFGV